jgi:hypothetical protein
MPGRQEKPAIFYEVAGFIYIFL